MRNNASRTRRIALAGLVIAAISVLGLASPAAAHDGLVSSYPEAGGTIPNSPDEITLTFSAELTNLEGATDIEVLNDQGTNVAVDAPAVSGTAVTQHLSPDAGGGLFTVRWKVVSSDGHPTSGEYSYSVTASTPPAATSPAIATPEQSAQPSSSATPEPSTSPAEYGGTASGGAAMGDGLLLPLMFVSSLILVLGVSAAGVILAGRARRRRDRAEGEAGAGEE
ncbi:MULTISPECIES: copper resistance CopC family protein [Microbacterium]|uniref:copper resistance CopC family protein n=1 Tax=Microbacterium TaxID=33882 RepID=UPI000468F05F|nr:MULTISPECIES: copper resistance CopC family protein [Microbacterium]AMG83197.1 hypothetical protein AXH82_07305 [Microbacterium sp. PAMC 28756]QXE30051.1 copper resistance protein CopC [Microbacterium paraoxydans]